jgi:hypothetical protein
MNTDDAGQDRGRQTITSYAEGGFIKLPGGRSWKRNGRMLYMLR